MELTVYIQDILQMGEQTTVVLKALNRCQLRHIIALWQFLSAQKSEQQLRLNKVSLTSTFHWREKHQPLFPGLNAPRVNPSFQELFRDVDVKYKQDLSPQHTRLLSTFLNEAGLDAFLLELHEMIVLKLRGPQAENSFNPNWRYGLA